MSKPLFVFTGDNHLRPRTWAKHPELTEDAYVSMGQIVDFCRGQRLPLVTLGDLFDKDLPDSQSVSAYYSMADWMRAADLRWYYVQGNHDLAAPPWPSIHPWALPLRALAIGGQLVRGWDFASAGELPEVMARLAEQPRASILVAHQAWSDIRAIGGSDGDFSMLPYGCVLLTGDYHVNGVWEGKAANGETVTAYSPGSTCMQSLSESPDKFFGVMYSDMRVAWHRLQTRPKITVSLEDETDLSTFVSPGGQLAAEEANLFVPDDARIRKPILHVRFLVTIPEAYQRITAAAGDRFHLFLDPRPPKPEAAKNTDADDGAFDNLLSTLDYMRPQMPEPVYHAAQRLLRSNTPEEEIEKVFDEHLQSYTC